MKKFIFLVFTIIILSLSYTDKLFEILDTASTGSKISLELEQSKPQERKNPTSPLTEATMPNRSTNKKKLITSKPKLISMTSTNAVTIYDDEPTNDNEFGDDERVIDPDEWPGKDIDNSIKETPILSRDLVIYDDEPSTTDYEETEEHDLEY